MLCIKMFIMWDIFVTDYKKASMIKKKPLKFTYSYFLLGCNILWDITWKFFNVREKV